MFKLLLWRFWPALIPVVLYLAWRAIKARKGHEVPALSEKGPWFWVALSSLGLVILSFLFFGLAMPAEKGPFTPSHIVDGKVVSGQVE